MSDNRFVYLDHAATTPVKPEVLEAMLPYFSNKFGNASSIYSIGRESKKAIEEARKRLPRQLARFPGKFSSPVPAPKQIIGYQRCCICQQGQRPAYNNHCNRTSCSTPRMSVPGK